MPWRLASKFQAAQHRREAYLRVLEDQLPAFQAALRESFSSPPSLSPSSSSIDREKERRREEDDDKKKGKRAAAAGVMAGTPMEYSFLFEDPPLSTTSPTSFPSYDPRREFSSASDCPSPLPLFPPGWAEHVLREVVLATAGVIAEEWVRAHRAYFLSALVHPSYISYIHQMATTTATTKGRVGDSASSSSSRRRYEQDLHSRQHQKHAARQSLENWPALLSDKKVRDAIAMPVAFLRAGGAALRVMEEVSWIPELVPLPPLSSSFSGAPHCGAWRKEEEEDNDAAAGRGTEDGEEKKRSNGRGSRSLPLDAPPPRAPPLTAHRLLSLAIQSGLASCILWHPPTFFSSYRGGRGENSSSSAPTSCEMRRIPSSFIFMENPTRESFQGKKVGEGSMESGGAVTFAFSSPPTSTRMQMMEEMPIEIMADGVTAFCGAIELVMGTIRVAEFLDLYISSEGTEDKKG